MNGAALYSLFSSRQRDLNGDVVNLGCGTTARPKSALGGVLNGLTWADTSVEIGSTGQPSLLDMELFYKYTMYMLKSAIEDHVSPPSQLEDKGVQNLLCRSSGPHIMKIASC